MNEAWVVVGAVALTGVLLAMVLRLQRLVRQKGDTLSSVEGEEARMFAFLHQLGEAVAPRRDAPELHRMIVDGMVQVMGARGGALYLLDDAGECLQPKYLSEHCPALVGVPAEVRARAALDPRVLESHLRLTRVAADEGLLGEALKLGEALRIDDLRGHEALRDAPAASAGGAVSALAAPLQYGGRDLGVLAVARRAAEGPFSANDFAVFRATAEQSGFALGHALVYREASEKRRFEGEIRNAREVQRVLLPQGEPRVPGFRIAGTNVPARLISGDYYDHLDLGGGRHGVVIADVSGKGVAAGLMMAMCRSVLRCQAEIHREPREVIAALNRLLFPDIREDMFISLFFGLLTEHEGRVELIRAGHDAALWCRSHGREIEELKPAGMALGIDDGTAFERVTRPFEIVMDSGDILLFHTDGVKEAHNPRGEEFGIERLEKSFREHAEMGAEAVVAGIQEDLRVFCDGAPQLDDVTLLAIERR